MGLIKNLKYRYLKLTGRIEKKWPIQATIWELRGEEWQKTSDRARTIVQEEGDMELEFYRHGTSPEVSYEHFNNRKDGKNEVEFIKPDRTTLLPARTRIKNKDDDSIENVVEKVYDIKKWEEWAENAFQENSKIVEQEEEKHWIRENAMYIGVFIMLLGGAIYFVGLGVGLRKWVTEPILKKAGKNALPFLALTGKKTLNKFKKGVSK